MQQVDLNIVPAPELGEPGELGGAIESSGLFADIHDRPIGLRLRDIKTSLGDETALLPLPEGSPGWQLFSRFELWLVPHTMSIVRRSGLYEPTAVGLEVQYKNGERTCSVRALIPSFRAIDRGHIRGAIGMNGELDVSQSAKGPATKALEFLGLRFGLQAGGSLSFNLDATVATPLVTAVGVNSSKCEWRFDRDRDPLFGRDIQTWSVLALPKRQREISYDMRFYIEARRAFITRRVESAWVPVQCQLTANE